MWVVLGCVFFVVAIVGMALLFEKMGDAMMNSKSMQRSIHERAELQASQIMAQARIANVNGTRAKTPTELEQESKDSKKASVVKRAAVGAAIAGETGAIIGAASAINENMSKNK